MPGMQSLRRHLPLLAVLAAYLIIGSLYATRIPDWQAPDEPAHYNVTRAMAQGIWPRIEASDWDAKVVPIAPDARNVPVDKITYEDHQPPLFYLSSLPVFALSGGSLSALRLWALLCGGVVVAGAYATVLAIFPGHHHALAGLAATVVALLPQHLSILASYNNDALSEALLALVIWRCVLVLRDGASPRAALLLGLLTGACFLTKAQAYLAAPLAALALLWAGASLARFMRFGLAALALGAPLWIRNVLTYGGLDLLGLQAHNAAVTGQPTTAEWIAQFGPGGLLMRLLQTTFQSWWGQFGWMSVLPSPRIYLLLLAFTLLSAGVFLAWWLRRGRALDAAPRRQMTLLAALAALTGLAFAWYNAQFVQHQGRYLYPALIPVAIAFALGWDSLLRGARWVWPAFLALFAGLDLYMLLRVILPGMR